MDYERVELEQPRYGTVNAYRVGDTLVDTGHINPASTERLLDVLDGVERVVVTHPHVDHVGASLTVPQVTELPHVVFSGADDVLRDYDGYVRSARTEQIELATEGDCRPGPNDAYFPSDVAYASDAIHVDRVVQPGETVRVGPYDCEVVHTPGHCTQHMSLFHAESGVMLSGDIVSRNGHYMFGAVYWDVGEYRTGLRRVRERAPEVLLPGHGPVLTDALARVDDALEKADRAERSIRSVVAERGAVGPRTLARAAFDATDETVDFLATVAAAYAIHMAEQGQVAVEREPEIVVKPV
jgi:glyoxylase-like metal-dependent hydrolase (beta-lactamase superfamily II)